MRTLRDNTTPLKQDELKCQCPNCDAFIGFMDGEVFDFKQIKFLATEKEIVAGEVPDSSGDLNESTECISCPTCDANIEVDI